MNEVTTDISVPAILALRAALSSRPMLGFDTSQWADGDLRGAKAAFVGFTSGLVVTNTNDTGAGSLRQAITQANTDGGNGQLDQITFAPSLAGQTITVASTLTITQGMIIDGAISGSPGVTVSGGGAVGVFTVNESANAAQVNINNLGVSNGNSTGATGASGAAPDANGTAGGNSAGGIYLRSGNLSLFNDAFTNNAATGGTGGNAGPPSMNGGPKGVGGVGGSAAGAVFVEQGATIQANTLVFSGNTATGGTGGFSFGPTAIAGTGYSNSNNATVNNAAACFTSGTLIRTIRGDVAVEDLVVGDLTVTTSGEHRAIRWIGSRRLVIHLATDPAIVMPVRIRAGALGDDRPTRDLLVSPGHAICLDILGEVLIPAYALVNGTTITQQDVDTVTYWHVELDSHDILIAEGQPAESYLEMGNRGFFATSDVIALDATPDADTATRTFADFCRPYVADGAVLDAVRAQVQARAERLGWRLDDAPWAGMHLMVDGVRIEADKHGLTARFVLPAASKDVWLVSEVSAPCAISSNRDPRRLGLCIHRITVDDGVGEKRSVALDDPRLCVGFHQCEQGVRRWTTGRSWLPAELFAGCRGTVFLRLDLAAPALPRWIAPEAADLAIEDLPAAPRLKLVAA